MPFAATILTLFPDMFPGPLGQSLAGRALKDGLWTLTAQDIRTFATDRHRTVDDHPAGGGVGMVLKPDILAAAIDGTPHQGPRLLMSPRGEPLTQKVVTELAEEPGCLIVCGRFEGVDQRVIEQRGLREVSIGDYIL
jgi:tRNA (guanine37-N1)-methyltransferase